MGRFTGFLGLLPLPVLSDDSLRAPLAGAPSRGSGARRICGNSNRLRAGCAQGSTLLAESELEHSRPGIQ